MVMVGVSVGVGVGVSVGSGVEVFVGVLVGVFVGTGVVVDISVGVALGVSVEVSDGSETVVSVGVRISPAILVPGWVAARVGTIAPCKVAVGTKGVGFGVHEMSSETARISKIIDCGRVTKFKVSETVDIFCLL
jgi:hypothetical protein